MEKTYQFVQHESPITIKEIRNLYKGYWVYIVNSELSETNAIISGIPVIIGSCAYDGTEDGIYKKYKTDEYVPRVGVGLLPNKGFISALRFPVAANG